MFIYGANTLNCIYFRTKIFESWLIRAQKKLYKMKKLKRKIMHTFIFFTYPIYLCIAVSQSSLGFRVFTKGSIPLGRSLCRFSSSFLSRLGYQFWTKGLISCKGAFIFLCFNHSTADDWIADFRVYICSSPLCIINRGGTEIWHLFFTVYLR